MGYTTLMVTIIMYGLRQTVVKFYKIVYKEINMLLHGLSWIPIIKVPPPYIVWFLKYAKLTTNFAAFSVYVHILIIQIGLMYQSGKVKLKFFKCMGMDLCHPNNTNYYCSYLVINRI